MKFSQTISLHSLNADRAVGPRVGSIVIEAEGDNDDVIPRHRALADAVRTAVAGLGLEIIAADVERIEGDRFAWTPQKAATRRAVQQYVCGNFSTIGAVTRTNE